MIHLDSLESQSVSLSVNWKAMYYFHNKQISFMVTRVPLDNYKILLLLKLFFIDSMKCQCNLRTQTEVINPQLLHSSSKRSGCTVSVVQGKFQVSLSVM